MKFTLAVVLFSVLVEIQFPSVTSTGSKTFETNNGFPINFLNDILTSDVVKKKATSRWNWEVWDVVPGTHAYQVYVFNITNPDEVEKGGKMSLQQLGPYYYKEYRYKFGVSMNLDLTVNFQRDFTYTFDPTRSNGSLNDIVNMINAPFLIFSSMAAQHGNLVDVNKAVSSLVASGESLVRRKVKVGDLIFNGIDVSQYQKYLGMMGPANWITDEFRSGLYAVLKLQKGEHEGSFTVDSGLKNAKSVGQIVEYNEKENLTYWSGPSCNNIQGGDGSVFPPHTKTSDTLYMFEVGLCRSISFVYDRDVPYKSITGQVFKIENNTLEDPEMDKDNQCFCNKNSSDTCLKKGVLDISTCQFGAPYVMSYAHFLDASPEYQSAVQGLNPDPTIHSTQVTIEPVTGAVIKFNKRYQWNIWLKHYAGIDYFKKFNQIIIPLLWNDDIFTLDPDKEELLMEELASQGGGMGSASNLHNPSGIVSLVMLIVAAVFILSN